jgi:hypothetical protein
MGRRYLADFMEASKRRERSILQASKYRPIARVIQHAEARGILGKFIRGRDVDTGWLREEAERLRNRLADDALTGSCTTTMPITSPVLQMSAVI